MHWQGEFPSLLFFFLTHACQTKKPEETEEKGIHQYIFTCIWFYTFKTKKRERDRQQGRKEGILAERKKEVVVCIDRGLS